MIMSSGSLTVGKVPPSVLKKIVLSRLGATDKRVLLGPSIGEDASVIDFGSKALVVHSDPITGSVENVGWLAVNVCTNDIATRGVQPLWILTVILLPENFTETELKNVTDQIDEAAKQLGVAVVGGHSEVTSGINRPVIITTAIGETVNKKFVQTGGAKIGDSLIITKGVAIEGTAILAHELGSILRRKIGSAAIHRAKKLIKMTSVIKDALTAVEVGGNSVHAMHDATEGGVAGGLQEIAWASDVGILAYEDKMPIHAETQAICKALGLDPLRTISSGTLIISAGAESAEKIVASLIQKGIQASIIGKILDKKDGTYIIREKGVRKINLSRPVKEEIWKVLEKSLQTRRRR